MAAISVGSVEVDVIPSTRGIYQRLRDGLVPAATRAGEDAGNAAGRAFGPAMQSEVGGIGTRIGQEIGQQIAARITAEVRDALRDGITQGGVAARPAAAREGDQTGGAFARALRTRLEAAMRNLPEIHLTANSTDAERELYQIRGQIQALSQARIGIDVDASAAQARISEFQARLTALSASDADVAVRVDAGAAAAELLAVQALVTRLDGQTARVNVNTRSATANLNLLTTAAIAFGPAILPAIPVVAAGLGSVAAAAAAAGAGLGAIAAVAIPAFKDISGALQAQKAAQEAANTSTSTGTNRAFQLAGAQQALAAAHRSATQQIANARDQVVQAERGVEDAERSLADAQRDARQAQEDLTKARRTAAQELEDLNNRLIDAQLSERDASLSVQEARNALNRARSGGGSELEQQRAQLAYDQAVQRLKEQTTETKRLKTETAAANKAGVAGSDTVKQAQDRVAQAQRNVEDRTRGVADAQAQLAKAQQGVAVAQQNAADSIASAQRQLAQAQQSAAGSASAAATAQEKYQQALAKLTPSARDTFNAFVRLRSAFTAWSRSLQPKVMPIFTRALDGLRRSLPSLTPFVTAAADAISDLQDRASRGFKSPWWKTFKKDLQVSVKPAITGFGVAFGNVFKGIVLVIDAFLPHMGTISDTLQRITKRFADWAAGLKGSPEFERFLQYSSDKGPLLADTIEKIGRAFLSIGEALSPLSRPLLMLLGGVADAINTIATHAPWMIQLIYAIVIATKLWTIAQVAFNLVMSANPLVLLGLALVALVGFVIYAYNKFGWFRTAVQAVWGAIKAAAVAVYNWFKGPFVDFFTKTIPGVFNTVLSWVKRNWPWILGALTGPIGLAVVFVVKHWDQVRAAFGTAWTWIKQHVLYPIRDFFTKSVPGWGRTLRDGMIGAFDAARGGIKKAWDKIKGIAKAPVQFVVDTVYNNGIRKVWNLVTDAFGGKHLSVMKFARGGVMPGYTPGRDVHTVSSVRGPVALSGGEAIMRPEWTRAVGAGYVHAMNATARTGGVGGVKAAMGFKDGGIFSGIGDFFSGAWDKVKKAASWLKDTFSGAVSAGVTHVVNPLINKIPGGNVGFVKLLKELMKGAVTKLVGAGKKGDDLSGGALGDLGAHGASAKQAQAIARRMLASFGWGPGQMAPLISLWNGESGWRWNALNKSSGAYGIPQALPASKMRSAGADWRTNAATQIKWGMGYIKHRPDYGSPSRAWSKWLSRSPHWYDSGGMLQPGLNLAYNGTGRPEPVFTSGQANALMSLAARGGQPEPVRVEIGTRDGAFADAIDVRIYDAQNRLLQTLNAG